MKTDEKKSALIKNVNSGKDSLSRRDMVAAILGVAGVASLAGCEEGMQMEGDWGEDIGTGKVEQALTNNDVYKAATMSDLRADPDNDARGVAILEGYWAQGDGGGGVFYWDGDLTDDDNGGTIIIPDAAVPNDPGRWVRLYSGAINIRWFGACGY